jgi:hypothetical protein
MTARANELTYNKLACDVVWIGNLLLEVLTRREEQKDLQRRLQQLTKKHGVIRERTVIMKKFN